MSKEIDEMLKEAPELTLTPFSDAVIENTGKKDELINMTKEQESLPEANLSPEEEKLVADFAEKIDLLNSNLVLQYGASAQKKIADFSETALENVKSKDLGEVGQMLTDVVVELKGFETAEEEKGFFGFFKKSANRLDAMKSKYAKAESNVNQICKVLENHQIQLLKDIALLDKMYDLNTTYFKELTMYILAGKRKLKKAQQTELPLLLDKRRYMILN
jgi:uncharacterized protein YaaN involved in tellurite resistance